MHTREEYIYLSYFMDEHTPLYGGAKGILIKADRSIRAGDSANTKQVVFSNHSGTHIDYPNHFFDDGLTSESYKAGEWIFENPFLMFLSTEQDQILTLTPAQLRTIPSNTDFLIIKTGFGRYRNTEKYWKNNPGLSPGIANQLREHTPNLKAVGMDFISITSYQNRELGRQAHREFLGGSPAILLVEDMDLSKLDESPMHLMCFPVMARGLDGSPVTVIAKLGQR